MRRPVASRCSHVIEIERRKRFCNSQTGLEERVFRLPLSLSFARRVRIDQASLGKAFVAIVLLSIQKREDNKILTHFIHKINTQGYIKLVNKLNHIFKKMARNQSHHLILMRFPRYSHWGHLVQTPQNPSGFKDNNSRALVVSWVLCFTQVLYK